MLGEVSSLSTFLVPICDSQSQGPAVLPDSLLPSRPPLKDEESHVTQHAERGWSKGCQDAGEGPVIEQGAVGRLNKTGKVELPPGDSRQG